LVDYTDSSSKEELMKRNVRLLAGVAGVAALSLAVAACSSGGGSKSSSSASAGGSSSASFSGEPFRIAVLGGITAPGVTANNSATSVLSAQAGAAYANQHGGIGGRKVVVDVLDDKADPTTAVSKLREYLASHKPDAVMNSGPSTITTATLPILKQNNILSFNIGPTADSSNPSVWPLNFDLSASPVDYARGYVTYLNSKGYKKVGILHGNTAYGETFGAQLESSLKAAGFTVTANQEYDAKALDMTPQVQAVQASSPEALILDAYGAPLGYVLKNIQKLGWNVPILGDVSVAATGTISSPPPDGLMGTDTVKNVVMQVYNSTKYDASASRTNEAVALMKSLGEIKSTLINAYNYDGVLLMVAAAKQAGSSDDAKIATALVDPAVQKAAQTAMVSLYAFTKSSHGANAAGTEFKFIAPGPIMDGQYH
jgi:branched-chain amino acid transport system substrate-binding protein